MKPILVLVLSSLVFFSVSWADGDSTDTQVLNQPLLKTKVKREIVIAKDPFLAGLLSAEMPGLGQMYSGKWLKGGLFLVGTVGCYITASAYSDRAGNEALTAEAQEQNKRLSGLFVLAGLSMHVWNIIDSYKTANRHNIRMLENRARLGGLDLGLAYRNEKASVYLARKF